jgi:hypothetical protein
MKEKMMLEEKTNINQEIKELEKKCRSPSESSPIKDEIQNENHFNRAHKVGFLIKRDFN